LWGEERCNVRTHLSLKGLFVTVIALFVFAGVARGQKSGATTGQKYDLANESKIEGTVDEIKVIRGAMEGVHLVLKSGTETLFVHVAPDRFLKEMDSEFAKGDQVQVVGCKIKAEDGSDEYLARRITKNGNELLLRDNKGKPIWVTWNPGKK